MEAIGSPPWSTVIVDENHQISNMTFVPSIEKEFSGEKAIITSPIVDIIKSGNFHHIPMIFGFNDGEGILAYKDAKLEPIIYGLKDVDFGWYVPKELCIDENTDKHHDVSEMIKNFYCGDNDCIDFDTDTFVKIKGDTWFKRGIDNMVKLLTEYSTHPIYYYVFSFDEFGTLKVFYGDETMKGACHADDRDYLLRNKNNELPIKDNQSVNKTNKRFLELITNFIKTG